VNTNAMPEVPGSNFPNGDIGDAEDVDVRHHRPAVAPSPTSYLTNGQRLTLGIVVLMLVDVIWVASSELSEVLPP